MEFSWKWGKRSATMQPYKHERSTDNHKIALFWQPNSSSCPYLEQLFGVFPTQFRKIAQF